MIPMLVLVLLHVATWALTGHFLCTYSTLNSLPKQVHSPQINGDRVYLSNISKTEVQD